jgi:hypothetical protein
VIQYARWRLCRWGLQKIAKPNIVQTCLIIRMPLDLPFELQYTYDEHGKRLEDILLKDVYYIPTVPTKSFYLKSCEEWNFHVNYERTLYTCTCILTPCPYEKHFQMTPFLSQRKVNNCKFTFTYIVIHVLQMYVRIESTQEKLKFVQESDSDESEATEDVKSGKVTFNHTIPVIPQNEVG